MTVHSKTGNPFEKKLTDIFLVFWLQCELGSLETGSLEIWVQLTGKYLQIQRPYRDWDRGREFFNILDKWLHIELAGETRKCVAPSKKVWTALPLFRTGCVVNVSDLPSHSKQLLNLSIIPYFDMTMTKKFLVPLNIINTYWNVVVLWSVGLLFEYIILPLTVEFGQQFFLQRSRNGCNVNVFDCYCLSNNISISIPDDTDIPARVKV